MEGRLGGRFLGLSTVTTSLYRGVGAHKRGDVDGVWPCEQSPLEGIAFRSLGMHAGGAVTGCCVEVVIVL